MAPEPWPVTWMTLAHTIARRSKDISFKAGAVLVASDKKTFLGMGYNGLPTTIPDSEDQSDRPKIRILSTHAESNCLWFAVAAHGLQRLLNSTLYVNGKPCSQCVKEAVRARVKEIIWDNQNPSQPKMCDHEDWEKSVFISSKAGLKITPYSKVLNDYD